MTGAKPCTSIAAGRLNAALRAVSRWAAAILLPALLAACGSNPGRVAAGDGRPGASGYAQAVAAMRSGDLERAEQLLIEITTREPDHGRAWANLGMVWLQTRNESEAMQALQTATDNDPTLAPALNQLAVLYRRAGRLADAEQTYRKALAADPEHAATHRNLGVLFDLYLARPAQALSHYQSALRLDPQTGDLRAWIEDLHRRVEVREASTR